MGVGVQSIKSSGGAVGDVVPSGISFALLVLLHASTLILEQCKFNLSLGVGSVASIGGADEDVGGKIASTVGEVPFEE